MWYAFGAGVHARHRVGQDVDSQETRLYVELCRRFTNQTGIIAFPAPVPSTSDHDFWQRVKALVAKEQSPSALYVHYSWFPDSLEEGFLLDLSPFLEQMRIDLGNFYPSAVNQFQKNKKIYAIPRETSSIVLYFNRSLFRSLGVSTPSELMDRGEWSWEMFAEVCGSLHAKGAIGCVAPVTVPYALFPVIYSFGGRVLSEKQDSCNFSDDSTVDAIKFVQNLLERGHAITPEEAQKDDLFAKGKVGMFCSGYWDVAVLSSGVAELDWDVELLPAGVCRATRVASGAYGVPCASQQREEAIEFIGYASQLERQIELGESGLLIPADRRAAESRLWLQEGKVPSNRKVFLKSLEHGIPDPSIRGWPSIVEIMDSQLKEVWKGRTSAKSCCNSITESVNDILRGRRSHE